MLKWHLNRKALSWLCLLGLCVTTPALPQSGHWYAGVGYGKSLAHFSYSDPSITYYSGYLTDSYPLNDDTTSTGVASLTGGYEWLAIKSGWPAIAVGLGLYTTPNSYDYQGQVNETAQGSDAHTLYDYQFQLSSTRLMAETTFTWTVAQHWRPYAELGVGMAFNTVSNYSETVAASNPDGYVAVPPFGDRTTSNIAYQAGLGLGYDFNFNDINTFGSRKSDAFQHERVKVGYRWVDLGSASLDTRGSTYPYSLALGTLTTQELYLNFTHFF